MKLVVEPSADNDMRRDANLALGCAVGIALLVVVALTIYLWTL